MPARASARLALTAFVAAAAFVALLPCAAGARDRLGMFGIWGAFRDAGPGGGERRCYAIAMPEPTTQARAFQAFASVGIWPGRGIGGQVQFRTGRPLASDGKVRLDIGGRRFALVSGGAQAWAASPTDNAAILALLRQSPRLTLVASDASGKRFWDTWRLDGVASALDAARLGCARGG